MADTPEVPSSPTTLLPPSSNDGTSNPFDAESEIAPVEDVNSDPTAVPQSTPGQSSGNGDDVVDVTPEPTSTPAQPVEDPLAHNYTHEHPVYSLEQLMEEFPEYKKEIKPAKKYSQAPVSEKDTTNAKVLADKYKGIRIVSPAVENAATASAVAAYLKFKTVDQMYEWMVRVKHILDPWLEMHATKYRGAWMNDKKAAETHVSKLFGFIQGNDTKSVDSLAGAKELDPYNLAFYKSRSWEPNDPTKAGQYGITIQAIFMLIENSPEVFTDTTFATPYDRGTKTDHYTPLAMHWEDIKRAYTFLRHLKIAANFKPTKKQKEQGAVEGIHETVEGFAVTHQNAMEALPKLRYLTDAELEKNKTASETANALGDQNDLIQRSAREFHSRMRDRTIPNSLPIDPTELATLDPAAYRARIRQSLGAHFVPNADGDDSDSEDEDEIEIPDQLDGFTAAPELPPLSEDAQRLMLEFLASSQKILHDDFLEIEEFDVDTVPEDQRDVMRAVADAASGSTTAVWMDDKGKAKYNTDKHQEASFWEAQRKYNVGSAVDMSVEEAVQEMFDRNMTWAELEAAGLGSISPVVVNRDAQATRVELAERMQLTPKPWQVTAAAWLRRMEYSPLQGGLLADGCGTGKTNSVLLHIAWKAERIEAQWNDPNTSESARRSIDTRPTIVLMPNNCVNTWILEAKNHYGGVLNFQIIYSDQKQLNDPWIRSRTLPSDMNGAITKLRELYDLDSVAACRLVVLCPYQTFVMRFVGKMRPEQYANQDKLFGDLLDTSKCK